MGKLKLVILGSSQKYLYYNKTHEQYKIYKETLNKTILYSKKYIETLPQFCYKHFNCINIDKYIKGDPNLGTNFLFLDENNILVEKRFTPIINIPKQFNFNIITIDLKDIWKEGGSIRCLTQPLLRE